MRDSARGRAAAINQSSIIMSGPSNKSLQDPLEVRNRGSMITSANEAWNRNVFKR